MARWRGNKVNGYGISIQSDRYSRDHLLTKIKWVLDLMDKEHHNCSTHSQRNAYQAVIRHELEIIADELAVARVSDVEEKRDSDIPF